MTRKAELIVLFVTDALAVSMAWLLYYWARFEWQWFGEPEIYPLLLGPLLSITTFWIVVFTFSGMYRERYASSRFDELVSLTKVVTVGILVLFFVLFIDQLDARSARTTLLYYWFAVLVLMAIGRISVRSAQKALILHGYGTHKALIVGWSERVKRVYDDVARYPAAGLKVVGAIQMHKVSERSLAFVAGDEVENVLGGDGARTETYGPELAEHHQIEDLPQLIADLEVQDVLIALGPNDHEALLEVMRLCDGTSVSLKLVPDFYMVIGGMARTEHLYGLPLIEVMPEPMPPWEKSTKRLIDIVVSLVILAAGLPFWTFLGLLIRLTSSGPAIYRQQRVGQNGRVFTMLKYRTMRRDAEADTGPVWATENDPRYTPLGAWLRKTRLDEIPQFWNVLKGEMSLVGPRPERPFFVRSLSREIPLYNRRTRVKPGITGWAQVTWRYDASVEDVRQKVKYDLFYIANMSLSMDFKILFMTIRTTLLARGR